MPRLADALKQGVDAFLVKPVGLVELEGHLKVAQRIHDLEDQLAARMQERKQFYRDVLAAVSRQRLHLVDVEEIPDVGQRHYRQDLHETVDWHGARAVAEGGGGERFVARAAREPGPGGWRGDDQRHPACPPWALRNLCGSRIVAVRVRDRGDGISPAVLPSCVLMQNWSTKASMGVGFEMMLQLADEVWLATGPHGTTVQLATREELSGQPQPSLPV